MELHLSESGSHPGQTALKPNYRFSFRPKPNPALALEWEERMIIQQQASWLYSDGELIIICMGSRCNDFFEPLTSSSNVKMPPFWEHLTLQTPPSPNITCLLALSCGGHNAPLAHAERCLPCFSQCKKCSVASHTSLYSRNAGNSFISSLVHCN